MRVQQGAELELPVEDADAVGQQNDENMDAPAAQEPEVRVLAHCGPCQANTHISCIARTLMRTVLTTLAGGR